MVFLQESWCWSERGRDGPSGNLVKRTQNRQSRWCCYLKGPCSYEKITRPGNMTETECTVLYSKFADSQSLQFCQVLKGSSSDAMNVGVRQIDGFHVLYVQKVKIVDFSYVIVWQITEGKIKKKWEEELDQSLTRVSDHCCNGCLQCVLDVHTKESIT